jgi:hypothetical protein
LRPPLSAPKRERDAVIKMHDLPLSYAGKDLKSVSTVVNGCLISWKPLGSVNAGYIQAWAAKNLNAWDCSVERRGGNIDLSSSWSAQHFSVTSYSSLMALIGTVVLQYKTTGTIDPVLCKAFTSIRLLLFMDASRDEIMAPASLVHGRIPTNAGGDSS